MTSSKAATCTERYTTCTTHVERRVPRIIRAEIGWRRYVGPEISILTRALKVSPPRLDTPGSTEPSTYPMRYLKVYHTRYCYVIWLSAIQASRFCSHIIKCHRTLSLRCLILRLAVNQFGQTFSSPFDVWMNVDAIETESVEKMSVDTAHIPSHPVTSIFPTFIGFGKSSCFFCLFLSHSLSPYRTPNTGVTTMFAAYAPHSDVIPFRILW